MSLAEMTQKQLSMDHLTYSSNLFPAAAVGIEKDAESNDVILCKLLFHTIVRAEKAEAELNKMRKEMSNLKKKLQVEQKPCRCTYKETKTSEKKMDNPIDTSKDKKKCKLDVKDAKEKYKSCDFSKELNSKMKICQYCGLKHTLGMNFCQAYGQKCEECGKENHIARVCRRTHKEIDKAIYDRKHNRESERNQKELKQESNLNREKKVDNPIDTSKDKKKCKLDETSDAETSESCFSKSEKAVEKDVRDAKVETANETQDYSEVEINEEIKEKVEAADELYLDDEFGKYDSGDEDDKRLQEQIEDCEVEISENEENDFSIHRYTPEAHMSECDFCGKVGRLSYGICKDNSHCALEKGMARMLKREREKASAAKESKIALVPVEENKVELGEVTNEKSETEEEQNHSDEENEISICDDELMNLLNYREKGGSETKQVAETSKRKKRHRGRRML